MLVNCMSPNLLRKSEASHGELEWDGRFVKNYPRNLCLFLSEKTEMIPRQ